MFWCDGAESRARPGSGQVKRARAGLRAGAALPLAINVALVGFELLVAFLQAYVFAMLTSIYLHDAVHLH